MKNSIKVLGITSCLLFLVLLLNSCTSSDENTSKNIHSVDTVIIKQMQFIPSELLVKKGDTVIWINKDIVDHTVTEEKNKSWTSDTLHVSKSWKKAVTDSADYFCMIHPTMKGKISIK